MESLADFRMYKSTKIWRLSLLAISILQFSGCVEKYQSKLSSSVFFEALDKNGIKPSPVPRGSVAELNALTDESAVGFYELDGFPFAVFSISSDYDGRKAFQESNQSLFAFHQNLNLLLICKEGIEPKIVQIFKSVSPPLNYRQAGWFIYPLGACVFMALFISLERTYSLRRGLTFPLKVEKALRSGEFPNKKWKKRSAAERIVHVATKENASADTIRSYSRLEVASMSRGLFLLEVVVSGAPLIGLLGTVSGLVQVFSGITDVNSVQSSAFSEGIALALLTTIIGLSIAIPTLFVHSWLSRVIEKRASSLDWLTERLVDATDKSHAAPTEIVE